MKDLWCQKHIHCKRIKMLGQGDAVLNEVFELHEVCVLAEDVAREVGQLL
jgi:hypothetical protein